MGRGEGADWRSGIMKTFFVTIGTDNVDITVQYLIDILFVANNSWEIIFG